MDAFQKLKLEYPGIKSVIFRYSSHGMIANYVTGLGAAINDKNGEDLLYFLEKICDWYGNNISAIRANSFVDNLPEHEKVKKMLSSYYQELKDFDFSSLKTKAVAPAVDDSPFLFLSHCSKDKLYGDALEALLMGLGVKPEQLIYTSHPLHKIPLGEDIFEYLRKHITNKVVVLILWSDAYLDSPACLLELGAAWVMQSDYVSFFTPDFNLGNPKFQKCAIGAKNIGAVLKPDTFCRENMLEFKNKITSLFNLSVDEKQWTYLLDAFIKEITPHS